jgi:uncharacterized membrane-anchored protein YitT (DUF2179 family)
MRTKFTKPEILTALKNIFLVIVGTLILSFGAAIFIIPFDLVTGGISGIAIILNKVIPIEFLTVDVIITITTWLLFFAGLFILGKSFALKTLISTIIYPIGVSLFMKLTDAAKQYLIDGGYDPVYGARPLKRFIQQKLETLLARKMIAEDLEPGCEIVVDYDGRGLKA